MKIRIEAMIFEFFMELYNNVVKIKTIKVKYIKNKNIQIKLLRTIKNMKNDEFNARTCYLEMIDNDPIVM